MQHPDPNPAANDDPCRAETSAWSARLLWALILSIFASQAHGFLKRRITCETSLNPPSIARGIKDQTHLLQAIAACPKAPPQLSPSRSTPGGPPPLPHPAARVQPQGGRAVPLYALRWGAPAGSAGESGGRAPALAAQKGRLFFLSTSAWRRSRCGCQCRLAGCRCKNTTRRVFSAARYSTPLARRFKPSQRAARPPRALVFPRLGRAAGASGAPGLAALQPPWRRGVPRAP